MELFLYMLEKNNDHVSRTLCCLSSVHSQEAVFV